MKVTTATMSRDVPREYQTEMKKTQTSVSWKSSFVSNIFKGSPQKDFYEKYIFDSCILHTNFRKKIL